MISRQPTQRTKGSLVVIGVVLVLVTLAAFLSAGGTVAAPAISPARHATLFAQQSTLGAQFDLTQWAGMPSEKAAYLQIAATARASITPFTKPTADLNATFRALPTPAPITGFLDRGPNPYRRHKATENSFDGQINGQPVSLYGTFKEDDYPQGVIGVATAGPNGKDVYTEYPSPSKHGPLKITAVNGAMVSLVAKDGTPFTFDVNTRAFV